MGQWLSRYFKMFRRPGEPQPPTPPAVPKIRTDLRVFYPYPPRLEILFEMPPATRETQIAHSWNPEDRSSNLSIKEDDELTVRRNTEPQRTDCIRGKVGFTKGLHVWEIFWKTAHRGTHPVVGVATAEALLCTVGYQCLVGSDDQSWGWDLKRSMVHHNPRICPAVMFPEILNPDEIFPVPDKFFVVLDMDAGTLSFVVDGKYMGAAFWGLKGRKLFPIISTVWGNGEISMKYIGGMNQNPLPLASLCRTVIRQQIGRKRLPEVLAQLGLPKTLENYLLYKERR